MRVVFSLGDRDAHVPFGSATYLIVGLKPVTASLRGKLSRSNDAVAKEQYNVALDFLDQIVTLKPHYAEGWNRRATLHYTMLNYNKSMADIQKVLELEPRHFGALSGMATILERRGRLQSDRRRNLC